MKISFVLISFLFLLLSYNKSVAQTVIEMADPGDANVVLLVVDDITKADIVIYKTDDKVEAETWDCMWKMKKWGFSNFSLYISNNPNDSLLVDDEMGVTYNFQGKIYFTDKKDERGYKTPGFQLEGVLRTTSALNSDESKKSKEKARKDAEEKFGE